MRSTGKSICSLIMVFVLILFTTNQCATTRAVRPAEKRGADILIFKKNGSSVKGELLAVKNTLLLVQKKAGNPENIDVSEIKEIQVKYSLNDVKRNSAGNYLGGIIGGFFFGSAVGGGQ